MSEQNETMMPDVIYAYRFRGRLMCHDEWTGQDPGDIPYARFPNGVDDQVVVSRAIRQAQLQDIASAGKELAEKGSTIATLNAELTRLRKVERAAKVDLANWPTTKDGVRIVPDNFPIVLWSSCGEPGHLHFDPQVGWIVWHLDEIACYESGQEYKAPPEGRLVWPKTVSECYSTLAAAQVAKGGE